MNLEEQVVSLELAKKLKELGAKRESYFAHYQFNGKWEIAVQCNRGFFRFRDMAIIAPDEGETEFISAFTVAELLNILPREIGKGDTLLFPKGTIEDLYEDAPRSKNLFFLTITPSMDNAGWWAGYQRFEDEVLFPQSEKKLADTLSVMLIYLIENKLIQR